MFPRKSRRTFGNEEHSRLRARNQEKMTLGRELYPSEYLYSELRYQHEIFPLIIAYFMLFAWLNWLVKNLFYPSTTMPIAVAFLLMGCSFFCTLPLYQWYRRRVYRRILQNVAQTFKFDKGEMRYVLKELTSRNPTWYGKNERTLQKIVENLPIPEPTLLRPAYKVEPGEQLLHPTGSTPEADNLLHV